MKVALVHDYLYEYGGAERVLETLHTMYPEAPVYTAYYFPEKLPESFKSWDIRPSRIQKWPLLRKLQIWFVYFLPWMFEQFDLHEYDLVISSSSFASKGVITQPNQVHICYCHTPPRFLWGLNTQMKRGWLVKFATRFLNRFFRKWDFAAAQRVDYFVANSKTVQNRIKEFYNRDSEIIYPACRIPSDEMYKDAQQRYPDENIPRGYFLVASRLYAQKHVDLIVQAFNQLQLPLVIVGRGKQEEYLRSIAKPNIYFAGFVPEERFGLYYAHCHALVTASENEDFGMTIPEVNGYGKPVVAYKSGGHIETVMERKTGEFFDQLTVDAVVQAVHSLEVTLYDPGTIRQHAREFSEERFIQKMQELVGRVVSS